MHYARRPLIGSASGGVYRHGTRTSTKIRPDHGSALRGPDSVVIIIFIHQLVVARKNIQTYKYGEKQQKAKEKKQRASVHATMLLHAIQ